MKDNETVECLKNILNELIEKRKDIDHTLSETKQANQIRIPYQTFHKYVNGNAECSISNLVKIANYYKVSTDYLLGLSPNETNDPDIDNACNITGLSVETIISIRAIIDPSYRKKYYNDMFDISGFEAVEQIFDIDNKLSSITEEICLRFFKTGLFSNILLSLSEASEILKNDKCELPKIFSDPRFTETLKNKSFRKVLEAKQKKALNAGYKVPLLEIYEELSEFVNDYVDECIKEEFENGEHNSQKE